MATNGFNGVPMDEDDGDDNISLEDLKLMYAKLKEIHEKDLLIERDLKKQLEELQSSSIEFQLNQLCQQLEEKKKKIDKIKAENNFLKRIDLSNLLEKYQEALINISSPIQMITKDVAALKETSSSINSVISDDSKVSSYCQTNLTVPSPFLTSSIPLTLSSTQPLACLSSTSSSSTSQPFNAQDKFIEMLLDRKKQLEAKLDFHKKQLWFEGPEVMLVKLEEYEKLSAKASMVKKPAKRKQNQFDCYLELSDSLDKRSLSSASSTTSSTKSSTPNLSSSQKVPLNGLDNVVQLFFTSQPKQHQFNGRKVRNPRSSGNHTEFNTNGD